MSGADNQSAFNLFDDTICVSASDKSAAASLLSVYNYSPDRPKHAHTLTHSHMHKAALFLGIILVVEKAESLHEKKLE